MLVFASSCSFCWNGGGQNGNIGTLLSCKTMYFALYECRNIAVH